MRSPHSKGRFTSLRKIHFCDFSENNRTASSNKTRFYKYRGDFKWRGVKTEAYKTQGTHWAGVTRRVLIGRHNESAAFHLRYFEILPGGYSSFEKHRHEHVVMGVRGKGKILCGERNYTINLFDTLYISPDTPHQLSNPFHEPFGFLCIVNARRDKPRILKKESGGR